MVGACEGGGGCGQEQDTSEKQQAQMLAHPSLSQGTPSSRCCYKTGEAGSCGHRQAALGWRAGGPRARAVPGAGQAASSPRGQRALPHGAGLRGLPSDPGLPDAWGLPASPQRWRRSCKESCLTWQTRSPACPPRARGCGRGRGSQLGSGKQWLRTGASWAQAPLPPHPRKGSAPPRDTYTQGGLQRLEGEVGGGSHPARFTSET